jgi:predicted dehydrogenase
MNKKITVAMIGAGNIAGGFDEKKNIGDDGVYSHAGALRANSNFEICTVFDIDENRVRTFKEFWNIADNAESLDEIYSSKYEVVIISTPDDTHYEIIKSLLKNKSCKTIIAEKPLAKKLKQIDEIINLSKKAGINVVVNSQRRFSNDYNDMQKTLSNEKQEILSAHGIYIKGLEHIGITMIDTITYLFGYPEAVMSYSRKFNEQVNEYSYDFVLFYKNFNITVISADSIIGRYNYHIFELDILLDNKRIIFNSNSNQIEIKKITGYAYSGIRVLDDKNSDKKNTDYRKSMLGLADYVYDITNNNVKHTINTPEASYNNKIILNAIMISYHKKRKIKLKESAWKK